MARRSRKRNRTSKGGSIGRLNSSNRIFERMTRTISGGCERSHEDFRLIDRERKTAHRILPLFPALLAPVSDFSLRR
ncbi:hypothetical protein C481_00405 [Natrialba asiatica DSM 12278]|uniref:Uncharacterized protein n=1 Tax=Natrialba asiatica (strain ATCC 700177 / DSM 12278 / JCM 9576 / FERM P-10747 / NBRC 102637 / 172P1) TaxID=29540 RepID=M0B8H6_NATA1|nr:hypothetical protein C481_00405 [Natrialba asiatica DSM 12278]